MTVGNHRSGGIEAAVEFKQIPIEFEVLVIGVDPVEPVIDVDGGGDMTEFEDLTVQAEIRLLS
jgi:hypothetical protein